MRQVGTLPTEQDARRLCDYLLTQGVGTKVEPDGDAWALWVYDEDELDRVKTELDDFQANPSDPRYDGHAGTAKEIRNQAYREEVQARRNYVDVRKRWASGRVGWRRAPVTVGIIAACALVYLGACQSLGLMGCRAGGGPLMSVLLISTHPFPPYSGFQLITSGHATEWIHAVVRCLSDIASGQVWRLFTPMFLHFGLMHIVFNCLWMWQLGGAIELRKGRVKLLALVLASAAVSNLVQLAWAGPGFGGLSGVVYALLGYMWMKSRLAPDEGLYMPQSTAWFMVAWLVLCFTPLIRIVANGAHLSGLLFGIAVGAVPTLLERLRR